MQNKEQNKKHMRTMALGLVLVIGLAACSSSPEISTPPTIFTINSAVTGSNGALEIDGSPLLVTRSASVRLRGQQADASVVRPGVNIRGTASRDTQGRLTLIEGDVSYPQVLSGVLERVSNDSITVRQGERSITLPLAADLLVHGETGRADTLAIGRQVTAFGYDSAAGLTVLELWSAAVTMNVPGVSAPDMPNNPDMPGDPDMPDEDVGGDDGDSGVAPEQVFINLPLVRADRNAGLLQLGHPNNTLDVRLTADTVLEAASPDPNAFWQLLSEGMPVIVEGYLADDGVIEAWYVAMLPAITEPLPWVVLEGTVSQVQAEREFVLEGLTITVSEDTRYALEDGTNIATSTFWSALTAGDMVFVEGWQDDTDNITGNITANFIVRFASAPPPPQQVLAGRVLSFDAQARSLDVLLDDVVMRVATNRDTSYSEQTGSMIVVPEEPSGSPLAAEAFWHALSSDALVTVYGGYGTGDFVATHITWRSDETYLSVSGTISALNEAAQQVRLTGVDVTLQLSERTFFTDPYFFDPMPMPVYPAPAYPDTPVVDMPVVDMPSVDRPMADDSPDMGGDILPTAPLELFWQEAQRGRMVMADGVVRQGVLDVRFLTLLPDPDEPRVDTLEGIVSDLDADSRVFSLLDFPELKLDFASTRDYTLMGEPVSAEAFWAMLQEDDLVVIAGIFTADDAGNRWLEVTRIDMLRDPVPPPPPIFGTEGIVASFDSNSNTLRLFDVPELTFVIPNDALYLTPAGEANGAQFWRDVQVGDGVFVEGMIGQNPNQDIAPNSVIVQVVERFDNDRPQVVTARVLDLDRATRQFALENAPSWLVTVTADTDYRNAVGEVLNAETFWNDLNEGDMVTVSGRLNTGTTLLVADSITLTRRPNVQTIEGTIDRVDPGRQQFTLVDTPEIEAPEIEAPGITVQVSDDTRFTVESTAPPVPAPPTNDLIDPRQWLEPDTFVIVSGVLAGNTLLAQDIIIFYDPIFSEGVANVLALDVDINADGGVTVDIMGELADPCTQLARVEQSFEANTITLTVITRTDLARACEDVVVPFNERVRLERLLDPGVYTLNVNQQTVTFEIPETTDAARSPAFVDTVNARWLENERVLQLDIAGFLSDPCHIIAGYDVAVAGRIDPDGSQSGNIVVRLWQRRVPTFQGCAAVLAPFETTLELDTTALDTAVMPAGDYTIDVNGVQTSITLPMGLVTRREARVERIAVQVLESFPLQVQVVAYGMLPSSCASLAGREVIQDGNRFVVTLWQESILGPCLPVTEAFEAVITLDVLGLAAGDYEVEVNGARSRFSLPVDNIPELCGADCTPPENQP